MEYRDDILNNLKVIRQRIANACRSADRSPEEVRLLLATKTVPANRIKTALEAGATLIAENKVQEIREKYEELNTIPHESHFIGHLQTNKIKDILRYGVSCIQSLDRLEAAEKLDQRLRLENRTIDVFVQVNTSGEESKFGVHPEGAEELVKKIADLKSIKIKGLMTIGLFSAESEKIRECFRLLRNLRDHIASLQITDVEMKELSMGMSNDLEIAIEEGATIVRVGTAVFGKRIYPDSYYWNENL